MRLVRGLGIGALALGLVAPFTGSPTRTQQRGLDLDSIARAIDEGSDHVSARQLAEWIRDRRPGLRVIDVRSPAEFHDDAIPTAENMPIDQLAKSRFAPDQNIVLYSQEGAHAGQAWVMLRSLGVTQAVFVPGGLADWREEVLSPLLPANASPAERARIADLSHYFGGAPRVEGTQDGEIAGAAQTGQRSRRRGC
ncbi:rhodanese-like domain-containing protein [Rhodanobacter sp. MP7CTX1]|uniref:rhodanese-like domain-containing protein n=1 Tax=Rhodanobacter sp. MP7CTX1 TaxID=2723084 RepID=UPI00160FAD8F|nr:rhodanese-like domain-containing protein [Rhodanobacter sp. MP7CTX1]MBB6187536.1 rhodanese-related sulfurtransferase [Rhodanobacter sp. MP7CTX1]